MQDDIVILSEAKNPRILLATRYITLSLKMLFDPATKYSVGAPSFPAFIAGKGGSACHYFLAESIKHFHYCYRELIFVIP